MAMSLAGWRARALAARLFALVASGDTAAYISEFLNDPGANIPLRFQGMCPWIGADPLMRSADAPTPSSCCSLEFRTDLLCDFAHLAAAASHQVLVAE